MSTRLSLALQPPLDALFPPALDRFEARADRLLDAIVELSALGPAARERLLGADGGISPYVHVFLNGEHVPASALGAQPLADGDELCLVTAIRGG